MPNFFLAVTGSDGTGAVAYGKDRFEYDNNAYTITPSHSDGRLRMYDSHPVQPTGTRRGVEYVMTAVKGWSMTSNPETFCSRARARRNARDWAK